MRATVVPGAAGEHDPDVAGEELTAVVRVASAELPTRHGAFTVVGYEHPRTGSEQVALVAGDLEGLAAGGPVLVRVHSECLTGDALGSLRCDCGPQLDAALDAVGAEGRGVVVYLRGHEGRGIGLLPKLAAYALQDAGRDTLEANLDLGLPADARDYAAAAGVLRDLGVRHVRLLTNNLRKVEALAEHGVEVTERVPLVVGVGPENRHYLEVKRDRMGHQLAELEEDPPVPHDPGLVDPVLVDPVLVDPVLVDPVLDERTPHERTPHARTTDESTTDDDVKEQGR